jgi:endonuclease/exonuclease/phosphatase family metal-dependent hydrolase
MSPPTFRVASYNIHSCIGNDRQCREERILRVLREMHADVIGLQEVGSSSLVDEMEQFAFFEKHLGMSAVSASTLRWGRFEFGNALFTRGEILSSRVVDLTVHPFEARSALDCRIRLRGVDIRVIATHLGLFPHERRRQVAQLQALLGESPAESTVMLGDFNVFGLERRRLRRIGAPDRLPRLRTYPSRRPLMSLDRIWTIPNPRLQRIHVHRTPLSRSASDHLPIVADVLLDPDLMVVPTSHSAAGSWAESPLIGGAPQRTIASRHL